MVSFKQSLKDVDFSVYLRCYLLLISTMSVSYRVCILTAGQLLVPCLCLDVQL